MKTLSIKFLIYGIQSSGYQAEHRLRTILSMFKYKYPYINQIIQNDIYVDNCIAGELDINFAQQKAKELFT